MSLILISPYRYVTGGGGGGTTLTDLKPAAGTDDGFFDAGSGFSATDTYARVGDQGALCTLFARFVVNVPQGATISNATITLRAVDSASRAITTQIEANDVDDASAPTTAAGGQGLARTTANVAWVIPDPLTADTDYSTPDISTVIQEVVDRGGWVANNHLTILIKTTVAAAWVLQQFDTYEESSTVSLPRLTLTYT